MVITTPNYRTIDNPVLLYIYGSYLSSSVLFTLYIFKPFLGRSPCSHGISINPVKSTTISNSKTVYSQSLSRKQEAEKEARFTHAAKQMARISI